MVGGFFQYSLFASELLFAEAARGSKLPEPTRAAAMMALLGIALLGMLIIVVVLLGGHWVRRQGSYRRGAAVPRDRSPLIGSDLAPPPQSARGVEGESIAGTVHDDGDSHGETKIL